ncbi:hypothetical protein EI94DRAFT_1731310, partial [Lactarius quietus]
MASYLRNLFGGQNSTTPAHGKAKSRRRTESIPTPVPHYAQRANSYTTTPAIVPSPLRYPTYDSRTSHEGSRPCINRSASYKPPSDVHGRSPQFPQGGYVTPGSSRSNSSSSLYPGPVYGTTPIVPSPLSPSTAQSNAHAWQAGVSTSGSGSSTYGPEPSPTRSQARAPRFHMHPVLSYTRLHHAPISYDIAFTPSARTVVDRTIHAPVPALTLAQPATEPPIPASSRLVLRSPKLPWTVAVGPIALTNLDVLYAVHTTLMTRVTPEEWAALGEGSKAQRRVAEAYKQRCTRMGGGWEGGIRRVDWLGSKTHLVGVEIDKSNEA